MKGLGGTGRDVLSTARGQHVGRDWAGRDLDLDLHLDLVLDLGLGLDLNST